MTDNLANKLFGEPRIFGGTGGYYYPLALFALAIIGLTYNPTFAMIYTIILLIDLGILMTARPQFNFNSVSGNTFNSILTAGIFMGIMMIASIAVLGLFQGLFTIKGSILSVFWQYSAVNLGMTTLQPVFQVASTFEPIFAKSFLMSLFAFGVIAAITETRTVGRLLNFMGDIFRLDYNLKSPKTWMAFLAIMVGFIWLHFQAKGVSSFSSLTLVGIFAILTCIMIVKTKEFESAVYFHIINNLLSLTMGMAVVSAIFPVSVAAFIVLLMLFFAVMAYAVIPKIIRIINARVAQE